MHKEPSDLKRIERSICEASRCLPFISYIPTNEFRFEITDINSFNSDSIIIKSWNERDLASSYILFDRNGIFEKLQDELRENKKSWAGLSRIGNIDKLNIEPSKKKVLSINN